MSIKLYFRPETTLLLNGDIQVFRDKLEEFMQLYPTIKEIVSKAKSLAIELHEMFKRICSDRCGVEDEQDDGTWVERCEDCEIKRYAAQSASS
jgi:NADH pyrophosphatase NudC (nudix superfamily)